jgi:hypothetical protein
VVGSIGKDIVDACGRVVVEALIEGVRTDGSDGDFKALESA